MSSVRPEITPAEIVLAGAADLVTVRQLFEEYAASLSIQLCFQNFAHELATLPGLYAAPLGRLLLATIDGRAAGCVALRPLENKVGEMKRLFVRPAFRRHGLGRQLVTRVLSEARLAGYATVRLDTLAEMTPAIALYKSFGFREIPPYNEGGPEGIRYFELTL